MNGEALRTAGRLLFGMAWRSPFMDKFQVGDASLRRMCKDEREIPAGLAEDIEEALVEKGRDILVLLEGLRTPRRDALVAEASEKGWP